MAIACVHCLGEIFCVDLTPSGALELQAFLANATNRSSASPPPVSTGRSYGCRVASRGKMSPRAEAQFYPRFALVVRDTANPVIEMYPEAALGLFFTADHAI